MKSMKRQAGATLIEALIGLALSLVVTASMVALMSNSLGSASKIIQMSQLTDELRNAMSMMTRDVRRANYNANNIYCYANSDCGTDGSATQSSDVTISTTGGDTCMLFGLDRDWDGNANNDGGGAFRKDTVTNGRNQTVGVVEMWVGTGTPSCADNNSWVPITDPDFVDVTVFTVNDGESFSEDYVEEGGVTLTKRERLVKFQLGGRLILDNDIVRQIEDTIKLRNDFYL